MISLTQNHKRNLNRASSEAIDSIFSSIKTNLTNNSWVKTSNKYVKNFRKNFLIDCRANSINNTDIVEYVAASGPLHVLDGWALLGRAFHSHMREDKNISVHLGYYAELRAALSLLSSEGIGIFDEKHIVVDSAGSHSFITNPSEQGYGTHVMTWLALEHWANSVQAGKLLASIITVAGFPMEKWLSFFLSGSGINPVATDWLKEWGLDLKYLYQDKNARNEASYMPNRFINPICLNAEDSYSFLNNNWNLLAPSASSRFENLDKYLLRLSLEKIFRSINGKMNQVKFESSLKIMLKNLFTNQTSIDFWFDFLTRKTDPTDPELIKDGLNKNPVSHPRHHLEVLSRAVLLLRIATGAAERKLSKSTINSSDLKFWWNAIGIDRGFWNVGQEPGDIIDLWADIEIALKSLDVKKTTISYSEMWTDYSQFVSKLEECERVALWGLGL